MYPVSTSFFSFLFFPCTDICVISENTLLFWIIPYYDEPLQLGFLIFLLHIVTFCRLIFDLGEAYKEIASREFTLIYNSKLCIKCKQANDSIYKWVMEHI